MWIIIILKGQENSCYTFKMLPGNSHSCLIFLQSLIILTQLPLLFILGTRPSSNPWNCSGQMRFWRPAARLPACGSSPCCLQSPRLYPQIYMPFTFLRKTAPLKPAHLTQYLKDSCRKLIPCFASWCSILYLSLLFQYIIFLSRKHYTKVPPTCRQKNKHMLVNR